MKKQQHIVGDIFDGLSLLLECSYNWFTKTKEISSTCYSFSTKDKKKLWATFLYIINYEMDHEADIGRALPGGDTRGRHTMSVEFYAVGTKDINTTWYFSDQVIASM